MSQKITTCLWMDDRIEEAANYYADVFKGKVLDVSRFPDGRIITAHVQMLGTTFMLLADNPKFKFSEAVSFYVDCTDQAEVDYYWKRLVGDGGAESQCGWLTDRFGLSWQIIPDALPRLIGGPDRVAADRALQAMFKMKKIDIAGLEKAYAG